MIEERMGFVMPGKLSCSSRDFIAFYLFHNPIAGFLGSESFYITEFL